MFDLKRISDDRILTGAEHVKPIDRRFPAHEVSEIDVQHNIEVAIQAICRTALDTDKENGKVEFLHAIS